MTRLIAQRPPTAGFVLSTNQWTQPFWDAAREHRLVAARCAECGRFRMPPTPFCPNCRSQAIQWTTLSGLGTVYSYTVVSRAMLAGMDECLPYVPAVISLPDAGGVRLVSNVVDAPIEEIRVGREVRVVWDDAPEGAVLPRFALVV
jgi:uncharacterized OB-fold protein